MNMATTPGKIAAEPLFGEAAPQEAMAEFAANQNPSGTQGAASAPGMAELLVGSKPRSGNLAVKTGPPRAVGWSRFIPSLPRVSWTNEKKKFCARGVIFIIGAAAMPAQAEERSVTQKLASHTYVISRDLIETIYKPDYSRVPNPNPNWPHEPAIRLSLQWPGFQAAAKGSDPIERAKHRVNITMLDFMTAPIMSVDQSIHRLNELGFKPQVLPASYGLRELRSDLTRDFREYIAGQDQNELYLIHCTDRPSGARVFESCNYDFRYLDLHVNVYFTSLFLKEWQAIHTKTLALLDSMRKD